MSAIDCLASLTEMLNTLQKTNEAQQAEIESLKAKIEMIEKPAPEVMSQKEAAEFMHTSIYRIKDWVKAGLIKPSEYGKAVHFRKSDLLAIFDKVGGCDISDYESTVSAITQKRYVSSRQANERTSRTRRTS